MIKEIAVDPEVMGSWDGYRIVYQGCGVDKGRLILRYPEQWPSKAREAVDQARKSGSLKPVRASSIIEGLKNHRFKTISCSRKYEESRTWLENAVQEHHAKSFTLIVAANESKTSVGVLLVDDVSEEVSAWRAVTGKKVNRTPHDLADCAHALLLHSTRIVLVDPHFDPSLPRYRDSLREFLTIFTSNQNNKKRIELHTQVQRPMIDGAMVEESRAKWESRCQDLQTLLPNGINLTVFRWRDFEDGEGFHARYILSDQGGIRYDWGLDSGRKGKQTDVQLLDHNLYLQRWKDFKEDTSPFELDSKILVTTKLNHHS